MRVVIFCHSIVSDWNHGHAHFLRGVATELISRGHTVDVYEPIGGWSLTNLLGEHGAPAVEGFNDVYPQLSSHFYELAQLDLQRALDGADLVLVHEWSDPALVARVGEVRARTRRFTLLFHDTHHRSVTDPDAMRAYDLRHYDAVLAFGSIIKDHYLVRGWAQRAFVWHEAADVRVFGPRRGEGREGDLVWVGNWGDEERTAALKRFLLEPARELQLKAHVYGVRYPQGALDALRAHGMTYGGWLPNYRVPEVFGRFGVTVHVPQRPYVDALPGVPTIRPFEAMACGIPLVSSPWDDCDRLFTAGKDYLLAPDGVAMQQHLRALLNDADLWHALASHGRQTILNRHTCAHRVDELLEICRSLGPASRTRAAA